VIFGGIEAGGTKFVCAAGTCPGDLIRESFPTASPVETVDLVARFFDRHKIAALGIASFGPLDLDPQSPIFGFITTTPKPGWSNVDLLGALRRTLGVPAAIDTDVNAAALAEHRWGAAQGLDNLLYLTVGTGIGGGALIRGEPIHGITHPEMGHVLIPHDRIADPFPGCCPYHGDCLEGLASGPALESRWGVKAEELPRDHPAWGLEARYLALGLVNLVCTLSPHRVLLGGGVMHNLDLFPMIREELRRLLRGYAPVPEIVPPESGDDAGVLGALILAQRIAG
jgi:fructokinase